jgi:hypothetical protein
MKTTSFISSVYRLMSCDKVQHFIYGVCAASIFYPFGLVYALLAPVVFGLTKEIIDAKGFGTKSFNDFIATVAGGFFLMSWYHTVEYIKTII